MQYKVAFETSRRPGFQRDGLAMLPQDTSSSTAKEEFPGRRLVHQPGQGTIALLQTEQDSPGREAADKRLGAVDRIDHPVDIRAAGRDTLFFADDSEVGEPAAKLFAQEGFHSTVGTGHRIEPTLTELVVDLEGLAEIPQGNVPRSRNNLLCKQQRPGYFIGRQICLIVFVHTGRISQWQLLLRGILQESWSIFKKNWSRVS